MAAKLTTHGGYGYQEGQQIIANGLPSFPINVILKVVAVSSSSDAVASPITNPKRPKTWRSNSYALSRFMATKKVRK